MEGPIVSALGTEQPACNCYTPGLRRKKALRTLKCLQGIEGRLELFEMCFIFGTVSMGCGIAPAGVPVVGRASLEADVVDPTICTSCSTCAVNFEVLPGSRYVAPSSVVKVKFPSEPCKQSCTVV